MRQLMTNAPARPFMTLAEAADRWRLDTQTVRRHVQRGNLRTVRIGRRVLLPAAEISRVDENGLA